MGSRPRNRLPTALRSHCPLNHPPRPTATAPSAIQRFPVRAAPFDMAEGAGFEPAGPCGPPVFKTGAIDHSATPPCRTATPLRHRQPTPQPCRATPSAWLGPTRSWRADCNHQIQKPPRLPGTESGSNLHAQSFAKPHPEVPVMGCQFTGVARIACTVIFHAPPTNRNIWRGMAAGLFPDQNSL